MLSGGNRDRKAGSESGFISRIPGDDPVQHRRLLETHAEQDGELLRQLDSAGLGDARAAESENAQLSAVHDVDWSVDHNLGRRIAGEKP
jgi:hypothetical protein